MEYSKLEYFVSQPRLDRFLIAAGHSKTKAQKLYRANLRVSQAFYPILNLFEITLRNCINYQLSSHFSNSNWIIIEKNGFMSDSTLAPSQFYLKNSIIKAERNIRRNRTSITSGKVIAEQSFGFWTSLFEPHHYRLVGGSPIHVFTQKPSFVNRNIITQKLKKIREFRNRIYHNEPICFNASSIDYTDALFVLNEIYELLNWIDLEIKKYFEYYDSVNEKISIANRI